MLGGKRVERIPRRVTKKLQVLKESRKDDNQGSKITNPFTKKANHKIRKDVLGEGKTNSVPQKPHTLPRTNQIIS